MHDPHYSERSDVENEVGLLYSSAYVEGVVDYRGEEERWKEAEGREEMRDWMCMAPALSAQIYESPSLWLYNHIEQTQTTERRSKNGKRVADTVDCVSRQTE